MACASASDIRFRRLQMRTGRQTAVAACAAVLAALVVHGGRPQAAGPQSAPQAIIDPADPLTVPRIGLDEFRKLHAAEAVLPIDVREEVAYASGHIPGAVHVPRAAAERLAATVRERARGRVVVLYCSCPGEYTSAETALILHARGVADVRALVGGYPGWVQSGGRVAR
jgi:rhodanese-related sulfurtransferase